MQLVDMINLYYPHSNEVNVDDDDEEDVNAEIKGDDLTDFVTAACYCGGGSETVQRMFFLGMNTGLAVVMTVTFFDFLAAKNQISSGRSVIITDPFSGFNDQAPEVKPNSYIRSVSRHAERQIAPSMSPITNALLFATQDGITVVITFGSTVAGVTVDLNPVWYCDLSSRIFSKPSSYLPNVQDSYSFHKKEVYYEDKNSSASCSCNDPKQKDSFFPHKKKIYTFMHRKEKEKEKVFS